MNGLMSKISTAPPQQQEDDHRPDRQQAAAPGEIAPAGGEARLRLGVLDEGAGHGDGLGVVCHQQVSSTRRRWPASATNSGVSRMARRRGVGKVTGTSSRTRPGRAASSSTFWPRKAAS